MRNSCSILSRIMILALFSTVVAKAAETPSPEKLPPVKIVYFIPSDCKPFEDRQERLGRVMTHVQDFYRRGMEANGYGPMTFALEWESPKKLKLYEVQGKKRQSEYGRNDAGTVRDEVRAALRSQGVDVDKAVIVIFQLLLKWEDGKATELGPYVGGGSHLSGTAWVYDDERLDATLLSSKESGGYYHGPCSVGQFNTHYIGGIAHEMGHAFSLPHDCELNAERENLGASLMGGGNHTYGKELRGEGKGTFLSTSSALRLSKVRAFAGDLPDANKRPRWQFEKLAATWSDGEITLTGQVTAEPPLAGIIAYNDNENIGSDYDAKSWVAKPDEKGRFRLTFGELQQVPYQLRLTGVHENGATSGIKVNYKVGENGPNLDAINDMIPSQQLKEAFLASDREKLKEITDLLKKQGNMSVPLIKKTIFYERLFDVVEPESPDTIPADRKRFDLSDAKFEEAKTGWGPIHRRQVPEDVLIEIGEQSFGSGLYAHAPSVYRVRLGKAWETFQTGFGLQNGHDGSVVFIIKGDGKELFRSDKITDHQIRMETVSIKDVDVLELIIDDSGDGNGGDWGVWVYPIVGRE